MLGSDRSATRGYKSKAALGGHVVHAHQELYPGHDAVAIADAEVALDQVQLEPADVIRRRLSRGTAG